MVTAQQVRINPLEVYKSSALCFTTAYSDPRRHPAAFAEVFSEWGGVITQHLPGYGEGLVMERSWHVLFGMNNTLPARNLRLWADIRENQQPCKK
jgi:hypothetical protein